MTQPTLARHEGPTLSIRALWSLGLLGLCAAMYPLERGGWSGSWTIPFQIVGILLTVGWLRAFFISAQGVVMTSFFQIFALMGLLVSAIIISAGTFMIEVGRFGTANGFFWVLLGYLIAGLEAVRVGYRMADRVQWGRGPQRPSDGMNRLVVAIFVGLTLLLSAYVLLRTGGPLLQGVDRVTFWRERAPLGSGVLPSLVAQTIFFAAFYFLWLRREGQSFGLALAIVFAYVLIAVFVLGEKFTMFVIYANAWLMIVPAFFAQVRTGPRTWAIGAALVLLLIGYTAMTYVIQGSDARFVLVRAALQAQLMWNVFEEPGALTLFPERAACYFGCGPIATGQDYITFRYLPVDLFHFYEEGGNVLSGFMPSLPILTFGILLSSGLHLIVSLTLGFLQRKLVVALGRPNVIYGFLLFKLQFGLVMMWYVAITGPLRGLIATSAIIIFYRMMFPRAASRSPLRPSSTAS